MLPPEPLRHIRHIEIRSRRTVNDILAGQYESVFRGAGIAFEEVREYQAGDEWLQIELPDAKTGWVRADQTGIADRM